MTFWLCSIMRSWYTLQDFWYQALPLFTCICWKAGCGLGMKLNDILLEAILITVQTTMDQLPVYHFSALLLLFLFDVLFLRKLGPCLEGATVLNHWVYYFLYQNLHTHSDGQRYIHLYPLETNALHLRVDKLPHCHTTSISISRALQIMLTFLCLKCYSPILTF